MRPQMMRTSRNDVNMPVEDERLSDRRFWRAGRENIHLTSILVFVFIEIAPLYHRAVATLSLNVGICKNR